MKRQALLALLLAAFAGQAHAAPRSIKCEFNDGVFRSWSETTKLVRDGLSLVFDSINANKGTARLIGNAGTADVMVAASTGHINFIEMTGSGNMNLTSVYVFKSEMRAVHSRHVGSAERPMFSQYYGTCRAYD